MQFEVFRGLRDLVFAPITIDEQGMETWGDVAPLAGIQSMEKSVEEANEVIYFDDKATIALSSEGADVYTMTVSIPALAVRAILEGKTWDAKKLAYLSTKKKEQYYALGFKAGIVGADKREEYYWIYKGKFTQSSVSHQTKDNSTAHNTLQYTFTSIFTQKPLEKDEQLKYLAIDNTHKLALQFFDKVTFPADLVPKVSA